MPYVNKLRFCTCYIKSPQFESLVWLEQNREHCLGWNIVRFKPYDYYS